MTQHMIPPRSITFVPACGWVFYEGSHNASIEVNDDGTVTFGSAGDDGRFLVETGESGSLLAPLPAAGTTTLVTFDEVSISGSWIEPGESLAPGGTDD